MSQYSFTAKDMLLNNLSEHRVIRIDGSDRWMDQLIGEIVTQSPDTLLLKNEQPPADLEATLSSFLGVTNDRDQIRQALENKSLLNKRLVVIVASENVNDDSLRYLMELTEIGDFNRNAVTLVLRTSRALVELLTSTPALAGRLDGYYEEEKTAKAAANGFTPLLMGAGVAVVLMSGAIGFYLLNDNEKAVPEGVQVTESAQVQQQTAASVETLAKLQPIPESNPVVVNSETTQNGTQLSVARNHESKEQVPRNLTLKEQLPEDKGRADVETQKLVAELAQVLEKNSPDTKQAAQSTEQTPDTKPEINVRVDKPTPTLQIAVPEKTEPLKLASKTAVAEATKTESTVATSGDAAVGSVAHLNNAASVQQLITDWQDAWQKQDWPRYINAYIDERPHGVKMSLEEWRAFRKQRLLSPPWIKLEFGDVRLTRLNSHWFRAEFYQRFEKPNYADETTKRLELMLTASGWKIASENPIGTVVLKRSAN